MSIKTLETTELVVGFPHQTALFQKFKSQAPLQNNRIYHVEVKLKQNPVFTSSFITALTPLHATVKEIRRDLGDFAKDVDDIEILSVIYETSLLAEEFDTEDTQLEPAGIIKTQKKWARYTTDIEIVEVVYLGMAKKFGTFKKSIGELNVSDTQNLTGLANLLKRFKTKVEEAETALTGTGSGTVGSFVKASNNYIYSERGTF